MSHGAVAFFIAQRTELPMSLGDQSGLTRTIEPIENMIASGLQRHLQTLFNCLVMPVQSTDAKATIDKLSANIGGLPDTFAFYQWQSIEKVRDSLNTKAQALTGPLIITPSHRGEKAYRALIVTVNNRYEIKLYTKSMAQVKQFASRWMFAEEQARAAFSVNYGATNFPIKLTFDETLSIPERSAELSTPDTGVYEVTGGFQVRGYISQAELLETEIIYETETIGVLADGSTNMAECQVADAVANDAANPSGRVFWTHKPYRS